MNEFLKELGIEYPGEEDGDLTYVVTIPDSDSYSKVFSILDNSAKVHEVPSEEFDTDVIHYDSQHYLIDLCADYDKDEYKIKVVQKESELGL